MPIGGPDRHRGQIGPGAVARARQRERLGQIVVAVDQDGHLTGPVGADSQSRASPRFGQRSALFLPVRHGLAGHDAHYQHVGPAADAHRQQSRDKRALAEPRG